MSDNDDQSNAANESKQDAWTEAKEVTKEEAASKARDDNWQQDVISKLAFAALDEQRRTRRWGIFFKSLIFVYLFTLVMMIPNDWGGTSSSSVNGTKGDKHAAIVELKGVIADNSPANAQTVIKGLRAAFRNKNTKGVILEINSPGGSPVQSGYINDEIVRLREKFPDIPLYAVITDICASGGYYVAAAADEIYADKASLVGSIGVLMDSFGFVEGMKKLGVERRLLTAGEHKGFLDPFSPTKEEDVMHVKGMLGNIHKQFIDTVKQGRGSRLNETPDLFSGLVWTGEQSVDLGLVDALGSTDYVVREVIGVDSSVDFTERESPIESMLGRLGVTIANTLSANMGMDSARIR